MADPLPSAPAAPNFVHLHVHTEYSLLDGSIRIPDLVTRAAQLNMPAVAITDHNNMFGVIDFYQKAKKAKIKPIIGCEFDVSPILIKDQKERNGKRRSTHLTLLAENNTGYANLMRLVTKAHLDGRYNDVPHIDKEHLALWSEGLICLSGCITSEINELILNDQMDQAAACIEWFVQTYGKDNFFLEIHDHGLDKQDKINRQLAMFAEEFGLKLVAANDVHFLSKTDHEMHDVLICIGTNSKVFDENRPRYSSEVYFKTPKEMRALFESYPGACDATLEIAERCNVEIHLDAASIEKYPVFKPENGMEIGDYFRELTRQGMVKRYGEELLAEDKSLLERMEYEISVMEKMRFLSYFLIVWDFILWAKNRGIPVGPGRGSAAGSIVAYALGITDICPVRFGLIFERFLNPERISPPDVDVDFCQTRRGEVIDYVRKKYGSDSVSQIVTFGTMAAKSVLRDVGRVLGMGYGDVDRIAKLIPLELKMTLPKARAKVQELADLIENDSNIAQLWQHATYLEGLGRNTGVHAAGIVIADRKLTEFIPLTRGSDNEVVTQYAMGPLTDVGMLKMDFLGLKTLTVIEDCISYIHRHTPDFDLNKIPLDDLATYQLLQAGHTTAVFQLESGGISNVCRQLGVDRIEDIIALVALYRPGPMDLIPSFIARKKGLEKVIYLHPVLEEVSRETFGILIYQEQVLKAASLLGGYSLGEADLLRRAMGKKDAVKMAEHRDKFVAGCAAGHGLKPKAANEIFDLLEKFAGYGFNKSHSAAYGIVSYQTAFLKANYPVEFMAGVLSNEITNNDKLANFINESKRMGIPLLAPDINKSELNFVPEECQAKDGEDCYGIRYGLAAVKNVGEGAVEQIMRERQARGPFAGLDDFANRVDARSVNKKLLESLIKAGAFDWTGKRRDALYDRIDQILSSASSLQRDRKAGQASLFDMGDLEPPAPPKREVEEETFHKTHWTYDQVLAFEKELLGFYVSGDPLDSYRWQVEQAKNKRIMEMEAMELSRARFPFAGIITHFQVKYTKKDNKAFAVFHLRDYTGEVEVIAWNDTFAPLVGLLKNGSVIHLHARVEADGNEGKKRLTAQQVTVLEQDPDDKRGRAVKSPPRLKKLLSPDDADSRADIAALQVAQPSQTRAREEEPYLCLKLDSRRHTRDDLSRIEEICKAHRGSTSVNLLIRSACGRDVMLELGESYRVARNEEFLEKVAGWR